MALLHISALRQFARTATGDQISGDELARLITADVVDTDESEVTITRDQLKAFLEVWRRNAGQPNRDAPLFTDAALWRSLPPPPPDDRLALLLVDVLGVPVRDAAVIIGLPQPETESLLKQAREELKQDGNPKVIVIEDEAIIRHDLTQVLESMGVTVAGWADSVEDAVNLCRDEKPELIIADYDLGGERFDTQAIHRVRREVDAPVIFVTGHPDDVLKGEDFEPDFVISKPYRPQAIAAAVAHSLATTAEIESV